MKIKHWISGFAAILIGCGFYGLTGSVMPGFIGGGLMLALCLWESWDAGRPEREKRTAVAEARREIFDQLVDNGGKAVFNGKEWRKGSRIDPETNAVVEPGV